MLNYTITPFQPVTSDLLLKAGVRLLVKREDLNHPDVSGNKWWKLKYNLEEARRLGQKKLLTFGGAYSNHLYATSAAAKEYGFESIGIVRGEEQRPLNRTLDFAIRQGMKLHYVSRESYRNKSASDFTNELKEMFGDFYLIPEGGTNDLAIKGCMELAKKLEDISFDYLCLPVGTGGTIAGLVVALPEKKVIGFSALKGGDFLSEEVRTLAFDYSGKEVTNLKVESAYHFGGYGKSNDALRNFIRAFKEQHGILLDEVYTGKMMFGIMDWIRQGKFERGKTILALHTGGLQGRVNSL